MEIEICVLHSTSRFGAILIAFNVCMQIELQRRKKPESTGFLAHSEIIWLNSKETHANAKHYRLKPRGGKFEWISVKMKYVLGWKGSRKFDRKIAFSNNKKAAQSKAAPNEQKRCFWINHTGGVSVIRWNKLSILLLTAGTILQQEC